MANKNILIVEDEEAVREMLRMVVEFGGYSASMAANGQEGLELLESMPRPCLILLDLMMPVMNGWEFAEALADRDAFADIPIVVVTAFAEKAGNIRMAECLKKPFEMDALLSTLRKYCG